MEKILLDIIGMSYSQSQSGAYALILEEHAKNRRLPIIIGSFEAQAIAIELEKIKTPRPLTHDLFKSFADSFHIELLEVIIDKFSEGIFYAKLICSDGTTVLEIDSRTSDAIALALRFNCQVYTYENILASAGIIVDEEHESNQDIQPLHDNNEISPDHQAYKEASLPELNQMLQNAIENEEYEKASQIRDEINKRK